jgi:hypothetical protein
VIVADLSQSGHLPFYPISGHYVDPGYLGGCIIFVISEFIATLLIEE